MSKTPKKATSLLVVGFENTGKSTLGAKVKDCLVINCDHKPYSFDQIHSNCAEWKGFDDFRATVNAKIQAYEKKFGKYPNVVVIDTITHLYNSMTKYNSEKYNTNKFAAMEKNNEDVIDIAEFIRKLVNGGINVVIMAHTKVDTKTDKFTVPAQGSFRDSGSWQSFVSEAIFIERNETDHLIVLKNPGNNCVRTNIQRIIDSEENVIKVPFKSFDLEAHINEILENMKESKDKEL